MSPKSIQSAFFANMTDPQAFRLMFDQQPNVFFFVKDRESRLIAASEPMWTRLGLEGEADVIGRLDEDFYPEQAAKAYRAEIKSFNTGSRNRLHHSATSSCFDEDTPCCHLAGTTTASAAISRGPLPTQETMVIIAKATGMA